MDCDQQYKMICEETRKLSNKRTFGGAGDEIRVNPTSIAPYKVVTGSATGTEMQKRAKKDANAGGASNS